MSFMDKAKKAAEQAQQKLEEAQKQFNERQSGGGSGGGGVGSGQVPHREPGSSSAAGPDRTPQQFDQHGRPIPAEQGSSAAPQGGEERAEPGSPAAPASGEESGAPDAAPPDAERPAEGRNANPDPFKPLGS
ncbi:MAG: hypothetical protein WD844_06095 [Thermoleophilaceae bacterium]